MRRLPPLNALRVFEAAARHESIMKAAGELNVSHSAVSQQIRNLERYFGEELFTRKGRGVSLTPKAREYVIEVRSCLERLAYASEYMRSEQRCDKVTFNVTPSFAVRWLIPRIPEFEKCCVGVEARVETSETDDIIGFAREHEVIIRRHNMVRPGMECERILDDVSVAVVSPKLRDCGHLKEPRGLSRLPLLHIRSRMADWVRWFGIAGLSEQAALSGPVYDHFFLSVEAAINCCGVALCPRILVQSDLEEGRLVEMFPEITVVGAGFFCLYKVPHEESCVQSAIQWLVTEGGRSCRAD